MTIDVSIKISILTFVLILLARVYVPVPITPRGAAIAFVKMYAIFLPVYVFVSLVSWRTMGLVDVFVSSASLCGMGTLMGIVIKEILWRIGVKKEDM